MLGPIALLLLLASAHGLLARTLTAAGDRFGFPYGLPRVVDPFGVLENDRLDGENAGDLGTTVELLVDVDCGTLSLQPDGGFQYDVGPGFPGSDRFVYRGVFGTVADTATVELSAREGGPTVFTCWDETACLDEARRLGTAESLERTDHRVLRPGAGGRPAGADPRSAWTGGPHPVRRAAGRRTADAGVGRARSEWTTGGRGDVLRPDGRGRAGGDAEGVGRSVGGPRTTERGRDCVARPPGFEPGTVGLEVRCSIQLSYGRA